jgi:hypothetical protein
MPNIIFFKFFFEKKFAFLENNFNRELPFVSLHILVKKNNSCSQEHEKAKFVLPHKSDRNMQEKNDSFPQKFEQCFFFRFIFSVHEVFLKIRTLNHLWSTRLFPDTLSRGSFPRLQPHTHVPVDL